MHETIFEWALKYSNQVIMGVVVELTVMMILRSKKLIVYIQKKALKKPVLNSIHGLRYFLPIALIAWGMVSDGIPFDKSYVVSVSVLFTMLLVMFGYDVLSLVIRNQKEIIGRLAPGGRSDQRIAPFPGKSAYIWDVKP